MLEITEEIVVEEKAPKQIELFDQQMIIEVEKRDAKKYKDMREKAKVYFFIDNETLLDNLENRRNRPYNEYRKALPTVYEMVGLEGMEDYKARWSQYAGCTCGCSPGFVIDGLRGFNIYVTIK